MKRNNNKGFTLAELLIVVAIIAVLTAIAIPVFTTQLEKSREATDAANMRSVYAEVMTSMLTETEPGTTDNGVTITVAGGIVTATKDYTTQQAVAGWITNPKPIIGDLQLTDDEAPAKGPVTITASSDGAVSIGGVTGGTSTGGSGGSSSGSGSTGT